MRHLDLFAGIGGFSLAAQWMGWDTVAQVEWDEWCQKVLAKNFPDALRFGDIVEFNKMLENGEITTDTKDNGNRRDAGTVGQKETIAKFKDAGAIPYSIGKNGFTPIGHIDIITGGFPCQPFSHAGKRKGTDDSRYLWPAMLETIRRVKPTYVVGENVAGLVSMENGKTLDRILSDLEDEGYTTEQVIIPACAVGAWHRRDRIWITAHSNSGRYVHGKFAEQSAERGINAQRQSEPGNQYGEVISSSNNQGLQGRPETGDAGGGRAKRNEQSERYRQCPRGENGQFESRLGGMAYGLPYWVDGYWDREPEGVPRVATGVKDRVNRLKGLGNAIVPQIALQLFKAIAEYKNI